MAHINQEQRYVITLMLQQGKLQKEIALFINRSPSVISREIRRNRDAKTGIYESNVAQRAYERRLQTKPKFCKLTGTILTNVKDRLKDDLSPEQIAGEARVQGIPCASHEAIYQLVWRNKKQGGDLHTHLRNKGRRYRKRGASKDKRGIIPGRVDISLRPAVVDQKERVGDWEIDTVIGRNHKGAIVTMNDRRTGLLRLRLVDSKEAGVVTIAAVEALSPLAHQMHTITADNGKEFAAHQVIAEKLKISFYFARPYHSWERGANENANRLVRQYFPKKTDFKTITQEQVQWVEDILNSRPRKRLGFISPLLTYNQLTQVAFVS
jgi:IS30 family transposase